MYIYTYIYICIYMYVYIIYIHINDLHNVVMIMILNFFTAVNP